MDCTPLCPITITNSGYIIIYILLLLLYLSSVIVPLHKWHLVLVFQVLMFQDKDLLHECQA